MSAPPVIDIAPLLSSLCSPEAAQVAQAVRSASETWGFFQITSTNVSSQLQADVVRCAQTFYALPDEKKLALHVKKGGVAWRGYMPHGGEGTHGRVDQKEGMYFGYEHPDDHPHAGMPLHGKNQFPDADIPEMRGFVLQYIDEVVELGKTLCDAMSLSLGLDTHYIRQQFLEPEPIPLCRCFNYHAPGSSGSTEVWGIGEHTDFGLLTILKQDSPGLQVRSPEGRWVDVPVVTDGFVVNVGDMLDMLTGGRFKSRPHRVLPPAPGTQRISFPFFFDFAWTAKMIPLPLPPLSEEAQKEAEERWGGTTFRAVQGEWWQYLAKKVQKVFPDLKLPDFEANEVPSSRFAIEVPVAPPGTSAA